LILVFVELGTISSSSPPNLADRCFREVFGHLVQFLNVDDLESFRSVSRNLYALSFPVFKEKHRPVDLFNDIRIHNFLDFLKVRKGNFPYSRFRPPRFVYNGPSQEAVQQLLDSIKDEIRYLVHPEGFIFPERSPENVLQYLSQTPKLVHLDLSYPYFPPDTEFEFPPLRLLQNLQITDTLNDPNTQNVCRAIENLIMRAPSIRRIALRRRGASAIIEVIKRIVECVDTPPMLDIDFYRGFPILKQLLAYRNLFYALNVVSSRSGDEISVILQLIQNQTNMESLTFSISNPTVPLRIPPLKKLRKIKISISEYLDIEDLRAPAIQVFEPEQFPSLQTLDFDFDFPTGFPDFARHAEKLDKLNLRKYAAHSTFSVFVPRLKELKLDFSEMSYDCESAALRHIVDDFPNLEILDLTLYEGDYRRRRFYNPEIWNIFTGGASPVRLEELIRRTKQPLSGSLDERNHRIAGIGSMRG